MSRIGKQIINIPAGVTVDVQSGLITVTGPKGTLTLKNPDKITVEVADNVVTVARLVNDRQTRANHGTTRAHINNMIQGVVTLWTKELEIRGTGYKALMSGRNLKVSAGYSHVVDVIAPENIFFSGSDKTIVGQVASNIRKIRKPEPYKGKGIRYVGEVIKLKAGKKAKA
jgi:large subunit ribosomal protein L6